MRGHRHVVQVFEPSIGGVPGYVMTLAGGLVERGWRVDIVHPPDEVIRAQVETVGATSLPMPIPHAPGPGDLRAIRHLSALLSSKRPLLVHAHSSKAGAVTGIAARIAQVPSVYTPHGWAFERRDISRPMRVLYAAAERALARRCHYAVITVAAEEKRLAAVRRISPPAGVAAVHTGLRPGREIDRDEARAQLGVGPGEMLAAWVGRGAPQKRPQDLAPLARRLRDRVEILALGQGLAEGPHGAALAAAGGRIAPEGTDPRVVYAAADLFVQTSAWEGLPLAVLEAMDAGLPVVAYAVGGLSEQVEEGRSGHLVAPGSIDAVAHFVGRLANEPQVRQAMGQEARKRARSMFSFDGMLDGVEQVYMQTSR